MAAWIYVIIAGKISDPIDGLDFIRQGVKNNLYDQTILKLRCRLRNVANIDMKPLNALIKTVPLRTAAVCFVETKTGSRIVWSAADWERLSVISAQTYIKPDLIDGHKFHLHAFLMLRSWDKPIMFSEAILVKAAKPFVAGDWANDAIHKTTFGSMETWITVNVKSGKYAVSIDVDPDVKSYPESERAYEILGIDIIMRESVPHVIKICRKETFGFTAYDNKPAASAFYKKISAWECEHGIFPGLKA